MRLEDRRLNCYMFVCVLLLLCLLASLVLAVFELIDFFGGLLYMNTLIMVSYQLCPIINFVYYNKEILLNVVSCSSSLVE